MTWLFGEPSFDWLWPIMYQIFILAPLHILNGIYQIFAWVCGANLGHMLFGVEDDTLKFNIDSPIFTWIWRMIIIGVVACVIFYIVLLIVSIRKAEPIKWQEKIKWPILVFTSSIVIPLSFILLNSLTMALFQIVSEGEGISALIKREQFMQMHSDLDKALTHLKTLVSINDIEITDATGEKHILKFNKIFEVMSQILSQISEKANKNGLTNIQERTNNMLNTIDNLRNYFCDDTNAIFLKDLEGIKKILADTNWKFDSNGNLNSDMDIYSKLYQYINSINNAKTNWINLTKEFNDIWNSTSNNIAAFNDLKTQSFIYDSATYNYESLFEQFSKVETFESLNNFLIGQNLKNGGKSLWEIILNGSNEKWDYGITGEFSFITPIDSFTGKNLPIVNLNILTTYMNSEIRNSFSLVIEIYRMITGHKDTNWAINYGVEVKGTGISVGFVSIAAMIFVMTLFCLFTCRRMAEVAVLLVLLIVSASTGIVDDGKNFGAARRVLIAKMFTAIVIFLAFKISITAATVIKENLMATWENSMTSHIAQIFLIVGCLLGGYSMANWFGTQFGDTNGLGDSLRDIGVIKAGFGAAKMVTKFAGKGIAKGKKLAGAAGESKITEGVHKLTGNKFRDGEWKNNQRIKNIQAAAVKDGWGKKTYKLSEDGELTEGFELNHDLKNSVELYKEAMKSGGFDYRSQQILDKKETLAKKFKENEQNGIKNSIKNEKKLEKLKAKEAEIKGKRQGGKK